MCVILESLSSLLKPIPHLVEVFAICSMPWILQINIQIKSAIVVTRSQRHTINLYLGRYAFKQIRNLLLQQKSTRAKIVIDRY